MNRMRRLVLLFLPILTSFIPRPRQGMNTDCTPDASVSLLPINVFAQEELQWCWAASGQTCMHFFQIDVSQCTQAKNRFSVNSCCQSPESGSCNIGGWPEFYKYGFSSDSTTEMALTWDEIKRQIDCLKKPIAFSWHWKGSRSGHMMVITGYQVLGGKNYVRVFNPLPVNSGGTSLMEYDNYVAGSDHTHWNDYYNITRLHSRM